MKLRHLALVAAMSLAVPVLAHADVETDLKIADADASSGSYYSLFKSYSSFYTALESLASSDFTALSSYFGGADSTVSGMIAGSRNFWYANLTFTGTTVASNGAIVDTGAGTVTPVPGPEAGAGLGALAMLGVAYWVKRRRNEQSLAA